MILSHLPEQESTFVNRVQIQGLENMLCLLRPLDYPRGFILNGCDQRQEGWGSRVTISNKK